MDAALAALEVDVVTCQTLENTLRGKKPAPEPAPRTKAGRKEGDARLQPRARSVHAVLDTCLQACQDSRKRHLEEVGDGPDLSDAGLSQYARFTDGIALQVYQQFLHFVPRLVNVVSA